MERCIHICNESTEKMISFLENDQIDKEEWDLCIKSSSNPLPYAYSWYLDRMAPGWSALVDHNYRSVFPLPVRRKYGVSYIYIPPFMQCLGLFSSEVPDEDMVREFMEFIPEQYRFVDLSIINNPGDCGVRVTPRDNYRLNIRESYNAISVAFSSDCRRNIVKAREKRQPISDDISPVEAIELFSNGPGRDISGIRRSDYDHLEKLINYSLTAGVGKLVGVRIDGKLIYSLFYLVTPGQITLLFTSTSQISRELKTGYRVIDQIIHEYCGKQYQLDFAGSSITSVADFIKSFGAKQQKYYRIYKNNMSWPYRLLR